MFQQVVRLLACITAARTLLLGRFGSQRISLVWDVNLFFERSFVPCVLVTFVTLQTFTKILTYCNS